MVLACKGFVGFLFLKTEVWAWLPPCPCAIPNAAVEEHKTWTDTVSKGAFRRTKGAPRRAGDAKDVFYIISSPD